MVRRLDKFGERDGPRRQTALNASSHAQDAFQKSRAKFGSAPADDAQRHSTSSASSLGTSMDGASPEPSPLSSPTAVALKSTMAMLKKFEVSATLSPRSYGAEYSDDEGVI